MSDLSDSAIDALGDRLRGGACSPQDLRLLDAYRRSHAGAYAGVASAIRDKLGLALTGRPAKSTMAVLAKLGRASTRLSQFHDMAGCRIVVGAAADQERTARGIAELFADAVMLDRRATSLHGYRALHVLARIGARTVEVQVRTVLQQEWATCSELLSDLVDPALKYGGGPIEVRALLLATSDLIRDIEDAEDDGREATVAARSACVDMIRRLSAEIERMRTELP